MSHPLVAVTACIKRIDGHPFHAVGDKYLRAVWEAAGCTPLVVPAIADSHEARELARRFDGLMLTGSPSNVHPARYGVEPHEKAEPYDPERDAVTFALIAAAIEEGVPLIAICRGFQELNAALGGTLHARVHEVEGRRDHRRPRVDDLDVAYGPNHPVRLARGGALARLLGAEEIVVNSLHSQGIDRVSDRLEVEAVAPDGTPEAVSVKGARTFAMGFQWHPEYKALANPISVKIFRAFGQAAEERARSKVAV